MEWIYYLLEANLYLVIFYTFYRLFLAKETFYTLNRFYLITTSTLAFILPFVQLGILKKPIEIVNTVHLPTEVFQGDFVTTEPVTTMQPSIFTTENLLLGVYTFIAVILISKLLYSIYKILRLKISANIFTQNGIKIIELNSNQKAFSFFSLLFINPNLDNKNTIIKHEMVHIKQKHSYDILFFEIIQIFNWFNPFLYFIKRDIKLLHEYLADETTAKIDIEKYEYALFLIKNSTGFENLQLTNQIFNSSILKQRISMLNQKKSVGWARLKILFVLPLIVGIMCVSTLVFSKSYGFVDIYSNNISLESKADTIKGAFDANDGIHVPNPQSLYTAFERDKNSEKIVSITKRLFIINGKEVSSNTFSAIKNIDLMLSLNAKNAIEKYGNKGINGAIEVFGKNITLLEPPISSNKKEKSSKNVIMLPPPPPIINKNTKTEFYPLNVYNLNKKEPVSVEPRYIVVNGKGVEDNSKIGGYTNAKNIKYLNPATAIKKYGNEKGKNGAVEITGNNIKYLKRVMNNVSKDMKIIPPVPMVPLPKKQAESYMN